ncbi:MAG: Oxidoreductase [uncultured Nocardioidaceae bacterium]|uniref:Oxidoreductase n=1 Tax=uncultured Nocardioidaceae bacterium TaxID=253824 RepID=A0A6J4L8G6_9ACTN|nr:MAG: Oxidoreductase [uncultured Nocardioidaceae bacterium]
MLVYGAAALGDVTQEVADASLEEALAAGINHLDVAASYGDAELRLGHRMPEVRDRVFLATKTGQRDREGAWREIGASLERLQTDRVDLLQLHAVGDLDELDRALGAGGAIEAAVRAQEEGLVGAIGITGHGPRAASTHLEALRRFPFATVLTPLNAVLWRDEVFREAWAALVAEVRRQEVGLLTIKAVSRRNYPDVGAGEQLGDQPWTTWYEPLADPTQIRAAVSWVLAHEEVTGLATPGDVRLLGAVLAAERERVDRAEAEAALATVEGYATPFAAMPAGL